MAYNKPEKNQLKITLHEFVFKQNLKHAPEKTFPKFFIVTYLGQENG